MSNSNTPDPSSNGRKKKSKRKKFRELSSRPVFVNFSYFFFFFCLRAFPPPFFLFPLYAHFSVGGPVHAVMGLFNCPTVEWENFRFFFGTYTHTLSLSHGLLDTRSNRRGPPCRRDASKGGSASTYGVEMLVVVV